MGNSIEKITVIAKTYPERSKKYGALVCTAGINEIGELRRLYPLQWNIFHKGSKIKFSKWDIIEAELSRDGLKDWRGESRKILNIQNLKVVGHIKSWEQRRELLESTIDESMCGVQKCQKENGSPLSKTLSIIKPGNIRQLKIKPRCQVSNGEQLCLDMSRLPTFLPWIGFQYNCQERECGGHEMMCLDWELQELFRREGVEKTKQKVEWLWKDRDLYFMVGTVNKHPYSWVIIGLFYPPKRGEA